MTHFDIILEKMFTNCEFCGKSAAYIFLNLDKTCRIEKCTSCKSLKVAALPRVEFIPREEAMKHLKDTLEEYSELFKKLA